MLAFFSNLYQNKRAMTAARNSAQDAPVDALVIGGGFYGAAIAVYLARQRGLKRVLLVEREAALLARASHRNQARVHNGYHYPRSLTTAYRSRVNSPKFVQRWPQAIQRDFTALYAIARRNSKVTARQFERFCRDIGAPIQPADAALCALFEPRLIENVFLVEEYAFDATRLAQQVKRELHQAGALIQLETRAMAVFRGGNRRLRVVLQTGNRDERAVDCAYVFNCAYSGLNQLKGDFPGAGSIPCHMFDIRRMCTGRMKPALTLIRRLTVMSGQRASTV